MTLGIRRWGGCWTEDRGIEGVIEGRGEWGGGGVVGCKPRRVEGIAKEVAGRVLSTDDGVVPSS